LLCELNSCSIFRALDESSRVDSELIEADRITAIKFFFNQQYKVVDISSL